MVRGIARLVRSLRGFCTLELCGRGLSESWMVPLIVCGQFKLLEVSREHQQPGCGNREWTLSEVASAVCVAALMGRPW